MTDTFHYGRLMHKAMRGLMAEVLARVAEDGLPGEHHFFITFDTGHPGVDMPEHLFERYPNEMTVVLQDWFEDLTVASDRFAVTLNFGNVPSTLVIPFVAIKTFVDPSVEFGLRFDSAEDQEPPDMPGAFDVGEDEPVPLDEGGDDLPPDTPDGGGDVVSLDQFRKS